MSFGYCLIMNIFDRQAGICKFKGILNNWLNKSVFLRTLLFHLLKLVVIMLSQVPCLLCTEPNWIRRRFGQIWYGLAFPAHGRSLGGCHALQRSGLQVSRTCGWSAALLKRWSFTVNDHHLWFIFLYHFWVFCIFCASAAPESRVAACWKNASLRSSAS